MGGLDRRRNPPGVVTRRPRALLLAGDEVRPRIMAASIAAGAAFSAHAPVKLFEGPYFAALTSNTGRTYDVSPDGKRFLMIKDVAAESTTASDPPLVVVLNFFDELKRVAPARR